jgi:hypothetical protein
VSASSADARSLAAYPFTISGEPEATRAGRLFWRPVMRD